MKAAIIYLLLSVLVFPTIAQQDSINLINPSFEDTPRKGSGVYKSIKGWVDCGFIFFPEESPPDIHPVDFWSVTKGPSDGQTYLGLVVRDNESWETVSAKTDKTLKKDHCYQLDIDLSMSENYVSPTRLDPKKIENFKNPVVFRMYGGNSFCSKDEILIKTPPVNHNEWMTYNLRFKPKSSYDHIVIEAFYKLPILTPYNGHILVDNIRNFREFPCSEMNN